VLQLQQPVELVEARVMERQRKVARQPRAKAALQVLDQSDFERFRVGDRANDDRDLMQTRSRAGSR
jgi:hypothetical protein